MNAHDCALNRTWLCGGAVSVFVGMVVRGVMRMLMIVMLTGHGCVNVYGQGCPRRCVNVYGQGCPRRCVNVYGQGCAGCCVNVYGQGCAGCSVNVYGRGCPGCCVNVYGQGCPECCVSTHDSDLNRTWLFRVLCQC